MKKMYLILAMLLAGCATQATVKVPDIADSAAFEAKLRQDIFGLEPTLLFVEKGFAYKDVRGFDLISMGNASHSVKEGFLILGPDFMRFATWDKDMFKLEYSMPYYVVESLELKTFLKAARIVMISSEGRGSSVRAFETGGPKLRFDGERTKQACLIMAEKAKKQCVLP